jgi:hypothetical protein
LLQGRVLTDHLAGSVPENADVVGNAVEFTQSPRHSSSRSVRKFSVPVE